MISLLTLIAFIIYMLRLLRSSKQTLLSIEGLHSYVKLLKMDVYKGKDVYHVANGN